MVPLYCGNKALLLTTQWRSVVARSLPSVNLSGLSVGLVFVIQRGENVRGLNLWARGLRVGRQRSRNARELCVQVSVGFGYLFDDTK